MLELITSLEADLQLTEERKRAALTETTRVRLHDEFRLKLALLLDAQVQRRVELGFAA